MVWRAKVSDSWQGTINKLQTTSDNVWYPINKGAMCPRHYVNSLCNGHRRYMALLFTPSAIAPSIVTGTNIYMYINSMVSNKPVHAWFSVSKTHVRVFFTTMTSPGHVTSSVTWPFDSPWALSLVSYRLPIGNNPVSPLVSDIFSLRDAVIVRHIPTSTSTDNKEYLKLASCIRISFRVPLSNETVVVSRCWYAYTKESYYWIIESPRVLIIAVRYKYCHFILRITSAVFCWDWRFNLSA